MFPDTQNCRPRHSADVKNVSWILIVKLCVCQGACVSSLHPATHMVFNKSWCALLPSWMGAKVSKEALWKSKNNRPANFSQSSRRKCELCVLARAGGLSPVPVSRTTAAKTLPVHSLTQGASIRTGRWANLLPDICTILLKCVLLQMSRIQTPQRKRFFIGSFFWNTPARDYCQIFFCVFKESLSSVFHHGNERKMCSDTVCIVYWPAIDLDKNRYENSFILKAGSHD